VLSFAEALSPSFSEVAVSGGVREQFTVKVVEESIHVDRTFIDRVEASDHVEHDPHNHDVAVYAKDGRIEYQFTVLADTLPGAPEE
jgi:hypothetical protein